MKYLRHVVVRVLCVLAVCAAFPGELGASDGGATWRVHNTTSDLNGVVFARLDSLDPDATEASVGELFVAVGDAQTIIVSSDGRLWDLRMTSHGSSEWLDVAYGDGRFVTVGTEGMFAYSEDGIDWQTGEFGFLFTARSVVYGAGAFVAVGDGGRIYRSEDGLEWTRQFSGLSDDIHGVAHGPSGFVAVGVAGRVLVSRRGIDWTTGRAGAVDATLRDVAFADGQYVSVGDGGVVTRSPDGSDWSHVTNWQPNSSSRHPQGLDLLGVLHDGRRFMAVTDRGVLRSTDAEGWTWVGLDAFNRIEFGTYYALADVAFGGDRYVAVGSAGRIEISEDGLTWASYGLAGGSGIDYSGGQFIVLGWRASFVANSRDGISWSYELLQGHEVAMRQAAFAGGQYVGIGGGRVFRSRDGTGWVHRLLDARLSLRDIDYGNGRYVAVGSHDTHGARIYYSSDAEFWSAAEAPSLSGQFGADGRYVSVVHGHAGFVAIGEGPRGGVDVLVRSHDGRQWEAAWSDGYGEFGPRDVAYGSGTYVALGRLRILTSNDGTSWTETPIEENLKTLTAGPERFYGLDHQGRLLASSDAIDWNDFSIPSHRLGSRAVSDIAFAGKHMVAVGTGLHASTGLPPATPSRTPTEPLRVRQRNVLDWSPSSVDHGIVYGGGKFLTVGGGGINASPDGLRWEKTVIAHPTRGTNYVSRLRDVAFGNGRFVAVGLLGECQFSDNGRDWQSVNLDVFDVRGVAFGNGTFVVVGEGGRVYRSRDGLAWTEQESSVTNDLFGIAYGSGYFLAVGSEGVALTSADGMDWTLQQTGTGESLHAAIIAGEHWVAAGAGGALLRSPDGRNWESAVIDGVVWDDSSLSRAHIQFTGLAHDGNQYVAVAKMSSHGNTSFYTSWDARTWIPRGPKRRNLLHSAIDDVAYGSGRFVAIGHQGALYVSDDGIKWDLRTPFVHYGTDPNDPYFGWNGVPWLTDLNDVIYAGGRLVAVAASIATSNDGFSWHPVRSFRVRNLFRLAHGAGRYVAVGDTVTATSSDGLSWSSALHNAARRGVTFGNGLFVAVGDEGRIETSRDGLAWSLADTATDQRLHGVIYGGDGFVAVGEDGIVQHSSNGRSWRSAERVTDSTLRDIAYGRGTYIAVGDTTTQTGYLSSEITSSSYVRSTDGVSWTLHSLPVGGLPEALGVYSVSYGDSGFVIGGGHGHIWRSTDLGLNWSLEQLSSGSNNSRVRESLAVRGVTQHDGVVYVVGDKGLYGDNRDLGLFQDAPTPRAPVNLRLDIGETTLMVEWDTLPAGSIDSTVSGFEAVATSIATGEALSCMAAIGQSACTITGIEEDADYEVALYETSAADRILISSSVTAYTRSSRSRWRGWRLLAGENDAKSDD